LLLVLASVPTAVIGLGMRGLVGETRHHPAWVGAALLVTALLLVLSERIGRRDRGTGSLDVRDALLVGAVQGFAVMPGISRSGSTIAAALFRNVNAVTAVEFSMLVSIPAIVGANLLELTRGGLGGIEPVPFAVGFAAAFLTGAFSLKALQWLVAERRLLPFAVYCTLVGLGAMVLG
jgi:undecaprenyl-diphosphatase